MAKLSKIIVFTLFAFFFFAPPPASAANCAQFRASGFFFDNYESAEYVNNLLVMHFKLKEPYNIGRSWWSDFSVFSDECGSGTTASFRKFPVVITPEVKFFSVRFTSPIHYEIWNDETNVQETCSECSGDILTFPKYYEISFGGIIDGWSLGESSFGSTSYHITANPADPPIKTSTLPTPPNCTSFQFQANGHFFDNYEHAEYVNGLLNYHFRFKTPYNGGQQWYSGIRFHDQQCNVVETTDILGQLNTQLTPYMRYYSVRFSNPTHYDIWNDETNTKETCLFCSVDIPPTLTNDSPYTYVSFAGIIDPGYDVFLNSTPFPIQEAPLNPSITELKQFKSDSLTEIDESGITTEDIVVFQAVVNSPTNNQVKLQVEVKDFLLAFDEADILESGLVNSGNAVSVTKSGLVDGNYKWRARAIDNQNNKSEWQEFGATESFDFEVKLVPLYTQGLSPYPSMVDTDEWDGLTYANGRGAIDPDGPGPQKPCGLEIWRCGCAITSMVMLGRYYNLNNGTDNADVNPGNINNWLTNNNGYNAYGSLKWDKAVEYFGFIDSISGKKMTRLEFDWQTDWNVSSASPRITNFLNSAKPVVAYSQKFGHYFVVDSKLANTYKVKDPAWYNTKTLNDVENLADYTRGYNNYFNTANLFTYLETPKRFSPAIHLILASPAELLITDPSGNNKLGKNPITNESFNEISNGVYGEEWPIITSDTPLDESAIHKTKVIYIQEPVEGNYNIQVIGTGSGEYIVDSLVYDADGNSHFQTLTGNTQPNLITDYTLNFTPDNPEDIIIKPIDQNPPEAKIYFDKDNKTLKIEGVDDVTENPEVIVTTQDITFTSSELKEIETEIKTESKNNGLSALTLLLNRLNWEKKKVIYQIKDEAGNTLVLNFKRITDKRFFIYARLESLQYNSDPVIILPKTTLGYLWFPDKKPLFIFQRINVQNQFSVGALYNSIKNQTTIVINKQKQIKTGLAIIKLITKSGSLDFEF